MIAVGRSARPSRAGPCARPPPPGTRRGWRGPGRPPPRPRPSPRGSRPSAPDCTGSNPARRPPRSGGARGPGDGASPRARRSSWRPRSTACRVSAHRSGRRPRTGSRGSAAGSGPIVQIAEDRDDARRMARQRTLDPAAAGRPTAMELGEHHRHVVSAGDLLDAPDDLQRPLRLQFVEDELEDRCRPLGTVRPVIPLLPDRRLDAAPGLGRHIGSAVDHLGNGRHRDSGLGRDTSDRWSVRRTPLRTSALGRHGRSVSKVSGHVAIEMLRAGRRKGA